MRLMDVESLASMSLSRGARNPALYTLHTRFFRAPVSIYFLSTIRLRNLETPEDRICKFGLLISLL